MHKLLLLLVLLVAAIGVPACSSSDDDIDCERLAKQEARLLLEALPEPMRARAARDMSKQRKALEQRCDQAPPSEETARCQLAASDIQSHRLCSRPTTAGTDQ